MSNPAKELYDTIITRKDAHAEVPIPITYLKKDWTNFKKMYENAVKIMIAAKMMTTMNW